MLYDVAFTLMDLGCAAGATSPTCCLTAMSAPSSRTLPDLPAKARDGYAALPFFMALRAAIRAHIAASQASFRRRRATRTHVKEARAYFALAEDLLAPRAKMLVAIGGLSGSGKSTLTAPLAGEIGPPPGARTLNSDRTRKAMHKIRPNDRLPPEAYEIGITAAVYLRLLSRAMDALGQAAAVIIDAVYSTEDERAAVDKLAEDQRVPFVGLWLEADPEVLAASACATGRKVRPTPTSTCSRRNSSAAPAEIDSIRLNMAHPDAVKRPCRSWKRALSQRGPRAGGWSGFDLNADVIAVRRSAPRGLVDPDPMAFGETIDPVVVLVTVISCSPLRVCITTRNFQQNSFGETSTCW